MNIFLENYLDYLNESEADGWRDRVEVYIIKDDKIIVGKKRYKGRWHYLPAGGGIDGRDTFEQTAIKECLEELGIKIKNPKLLDTKGYECKWNTFTIQNDKINRRIKKYKKGIRMYFMYAYFDKIDASKYGSAGDKMKPVIMTVDEFIKKIDNKSKDATPFELRLKMLNKLKKIMGQ